MQVVYAREPFPTSVTRSVFLAGPTPRDKRNVRSWRPEALRLLGLMPFAKDGTVFTPEDRHGTFKCDYTDQVEWENEALNRADCILFWVPREMKTMPALTTNVEFGMWHDSGKIVLGLPRDGVQHRQGNRYLEYWARKNNVTAFESLEDTCNAVTTRIPTPAKREGGECCVPFHIWQTPSFQAWYRGIKASGNRLDGAKVLWMADARAHEVTPVRPFYWALEVDIHVTTEGRNKRGEIISRPDISTVVLFRRNSRAWDSEVALVREFRNSVRNSEGFVYEAPGGSSLKATSNPYEVAAQEVWEETGLNLTNDRFNALEDRQLASTMSTHKSHLFSVVLTDEEWAVLRSNVGKTFGANDDERTTVRTLKLRDLLASNTVDWSMFGMILRAVFGPDFVPTDPNLVDMGPADFTPIARDGYNAYGDYVEWKNYAGLPMPTWDTLPPKIQGAWVTATKKIFAR